MLVHVLRDWFLASLLYLFYLYHFPIFCRRQLNFHRSHRCIYTHVAQRIHIKICLRYKKTRLFCFTELKAMQCTYCRMGTKITFFLWRESGDLAYGGRVLCHNYSCSQMWRALSRAGRLIMWKELTVLLRNEKFANLYAWRSTGRITGLNYDRIFSVNSSTPTSTSSGNGNLNSHPSHARKRSPLGLSKIHSRVS